MLRFINPSDLPAFGVNDPIHMSIPVQVDGNGTQRDAC